MLVRFLLLVLTFWLPLSGILAGNLKIYYVRHGQSGVNVEKDWKDKPKEAWPEYVGNADAFSDLGKEQVKALPAKLEQYQFDFIAVSPLWRTRNTILPYLKNQKRQAEIWPELREAEVKTKRPNSKSDKPSEKLYSGNPIKIPAEERDFFILREDAIRDCDPSGKGKQADIDANILAERTISLIKERFGGTSTSVLLVGHSRSGTNLLRALTGNYKDSLKIKNAAIWMAEEQADGTFKIVRFNDEPASDLDL